MLSILIVLYQQLFSLLCRFTWYYGKCVRILCVTTVIRGESYIYGIFCKSMQNYWNEEIIWQISAIFMHFSWYFTFFHCDFYTFLKKINRKRLFHAYGLKRRHNHKSHIFLTTDNTNKTDRLTFASGFFGKKINQDSACAET